MSARPPGSEDGSPRAGVLSVVLLASMVASVVAPGLASALAVGCRRAPEEDVGPCSGFAERKLGITRQEYLPCAECLLALLDELRPKVRLVVRGGAEDPAAALADAKAALDRARRAFAQTGCERDFRSLRPGADVERFPDTHVRAFNGHVFQALFSYKTALQLTNEDYLEQGEREHDWARDCHDLFR